MTKEEKIQEAYGIHYGKVKNYLDSEGWCSTRKRINFFEIDKDLKLDMHPENSYLWRPNSLSNIENNNGWIKIENEKDLPNKEVDCHIVYGNKLISFAVWDNELKGFFIGLVKQNPTHYKIIEFPKPPLY